MKREKLLDWNRDTILAFIGEFEAQPVLWDFKHPHYNQNIMKDRAWQQLALKFATTVDELKKKMESLKGTMRKERNRIKWNKMGMGKGIVAGRDFPKWFAYESMKFLEDRERPAPKPTMSEVTVKKEPEPMDEENLALWTPSVSLVEGERLEELPGCERLERVERVQPEEEAATSRSKKRREARPRPERDPCSVYGEHVANVLRQLDSLTQAVTRNKINAVLFEAELAHFGGCHSGFDQPSTSHAKHPEQILPTHEELAHFNMDGKN